MNQLWDGIRNLPYTNHEVALIIKKSMHYFKHDYHNVDIKNIFDDQITIVVSDKLEVLIKHMFQEKNSQIL